ncbi:unnamed protein product [Symbiodinium microadriaticum]|nr:unnamed protein product [Symbiodinium sp. KB8]CAE7899359.1 unnamed protein product [Symbiodinium microadriaticum]
MYKVDKASMLPAVMRNDPCLAARPDMRRSMEEWWGGSLWDPRDPSSGEFFGSDFTCGSSMRDVLAALRLSDGESERLALAVAEGDLVEAERLLAASADVTPALHLALQIGAAPETVELLAACCSRLNVWLPEPAVVTWARATCRAALSGRPLRGATAKLDSLLLAGADVNSIGRGCETALHILARTLQLLWQESQRYSLRSKSLSREIQEHPSDKNVFEGSAVTALLFAFNVETQQELNKLWHDLVSRGADASMADGESSSALERLSATQCTDLLVSKRRTYAMRRYHHARLRGEDPACCWLGTPCDSQEVSLLPSRRLQRGRAHSRS